MKVSRASSPLVSAPVYYGSFEEYVADIQCVFSKDYGRKLSDKEANDVAKKLDLLMYFLV